MTIDEKIAHQGQKFARMRQNTVKPGANEKS